MSEAMTTTLTFLDDNAIVILAAIVILVAAIILLKSDKRKKGKKNKSKTKRYASSDGIQVFAILLAAGVLGLLILALVVALGSASTIVIGHWVLFGTRPEGAFQWFLVGFTVVFTIASIIIQLLLEDII